MCIESKGTDQFCSYGTADLRLCLHLCMWLVFLCSCSNKMRLEKTSLHRGKKKVLIQRNYLA